MDKDAMKALQMPILLLVVAVLIFVIGIVMYIVPKAQSISGLSSDYNAKVKELADKERQYDEVKASLMEATNIDLTGAKDMYKPMDSGLDAESIVASQFNDILALLRSNSIKARSVDYNYNPPEDPFVKGAGSKVSACHVTLSLIASYKNFENFLRDLYKHEHFLDIAKVEIIPYEKNKTILLINCKLLLYAKKV